MRTRCWHFVTGKGKRRVFKSLKVLVVLMTYIALLALSLFLGLTGTPPAQAQVVTPAPLENSPYDAQTFKIADQMQCPVCQGQTVAFSNSGLSQQMRILIKKKLEQGETEQQILQYFVDRYGESILTNPPKSGFDLIVWLLPILGLLAGTGVVGYVLRNWRSRNELAPRSGSEQSPSTADNLKMLEYSQTVPLNAQVLKEYEERVELELAHLESGIGSNAAKGTTVKNRNVNSLTVDRQWEQQQTHSTEENS